MGAVPILHLAKACVTKIYSNETCIKGNLICVWSLWMTPDDRFDSIHFYKVKLKMVK